MNEFWTKIGKIKAVKYFCIPDPTSEKAKKGLDAHSQIHNNHHIGHLKLTLFPYRQQTKQIADDYKAREESWTKTQCELEEKIKHEIDRVRNPNGISMNISQMRLRKPSKIVWARGLYSFIWIEWYLYFM